MLEEPQGKQHHRPSKNIHGTRPEEGTTQQRRHYPRFTRRSGSARAPTLWQAWRGGAQISGLTTTAGVGWTTIRTRSNSTNCQRHTKRCCHSSGMSSSGAVHALQPTTMDQRKQSRHSAALIARWQQQSTPLKVSCRCRESLTKTIKTISKRRRHRSRKSQRQPSAQGDLSWALQRQWC